MRIDWILQVKRAKMQKQPWDFSQRETIRGYMRANIKRLLTEREVCTVKYQTEVF